MTDTWRGGEFGYGAEWLMTSQGWLLLGMGRGWLRVGLNAVVCKDCVTERVVTLSIDLCLALRNCVVARGSLSRRSSFGSLSVCHSHTRLLDQSQLVLTRRRTAGLGPMSSEMRSGKAFLNICL